MPGNSSDLGALASSHDDNNAASGAGSVMGSLRNSTHPTLGARGLQRGSGSSDNVSVPRGRLLSLTATGVVHVHGPVDQATLSANGVQDSGDRPALGSGRVRESMTLTLSDLPPPVMDTTVVDQARAVLQGLPLMPRAAMGDGDPAFQAVASVVEGFEGGWGLSSSPQAGLWTSWGLVDRVASRLDAQHAPAAVWSAGVVRILGDRVAATLHGAR